MPQMCVFWTQKQPCCRKKLEEEKRRREEADRKVREAGFELQSLGCARIFRVLDLNFVRFEPFQGVDSLLAGEGSQGEG